MAFTMCIRFLTFLGLLALLLTAALLGHAETFQSSWLGDTFSGCPTGTDKYSGKWVQMSINGMYVAPDGTCYTASWWDEAGRAKGVYKDGDVLGQTWDPGSCAASRAVTGDGSYIYYGEIGPNGPSIRRYGTQINNHVLWMTTDWPGASGDGSYLVLSTSGDPATALAVNATANELYVADPNSKRIRVFNRNSGSSTELASWAYPSGANNCHSIVVENPSSASSMLWIGYDGNIIKRYSNRGVQQSQSITGFTQATGMCRDNSGKLLICDNGRDQNIKIYTNLSTTPTLSSTFGAQYGTLSGIKGEHGPLKFYDLSSVGIDSSGNIYVAMGKFNYDMVDGYMTGAEIRKLTASGTQLWQLLNCNFVDTADVEPTSDGIDIYGKEEHFVMDYSKPAGQQWTWKSYTLDRFTYPNDPRVNGTGCSPMIRNINGHRLMYLTDMYGYLPSVFRFDGEIAIPCGEFTADSPYEPNSRSFYYTRDANNNGTLEASEKAALQTTTGMAGIGGWNFAWDIDANGNLWFIPRYGNPGVTGYIYEAQLQGFDANGAPMYDMAHTVQYTMTMPDGDVARMRYIPATDTMYLTSSGDSGVFIGNAIHRYNNWKAGNRTAAYTINLPATGETYSDNDIIFKAFDVAGDYVFVCELKHHGIVWVYNANTGAYVRTLLEDPSLEASGAWVDTDYGIRAFQRSNGDYIITVEEDLHMKTRVYIWNPGTSGTVAAPTFSPAAGTYSSAQSVTISTATSGATIRYTTDGTTPTSTTGAVYSGPVSISSSCTLKAIAYKSGMADSAVTSGVYTISTGATTIGYTSVGSTTLNPDPNYIDGCRFQASSNMTVTTMAMYIVSGTGHIKCAIYTDNSGTPSTFLKGTNELTNPGTGWQTFTLTSGQALTGGAYYWLVYWTDSAFTFRGETNGGTEWYLNSPYGAWPSTLSGGITGDVWKFSIYASGTSGGTVAAPTFSPAAGTYSSAQSVTISTATSGATIRYTTDGATPTSTTGALYSGPVSISANCTLKAIAYKSGMTDSTVTSGTYTILSNIASTGTAYRWSQNATATANTNKVAATGLNDGNSTVDVKLNGGTGEIDNMWETAGITWSAAQSNITSFTFTNGTWTASSDGAFSANLKLQSSTDGTTWTDTSWTISPSYAYDTSAVSGVKYTFTGTALNNIKGLRITGQVHTTTLYSYEAYVREIEVFRTN